MNKILDSFSTRDIALLIWIAIAFILMLFKKEIRNSFSGVLKALFIKEFIIVLLLFFIHTFFYVFILHKLSLWDKSLIKDTLFWAFGFGFVTIFKVNDLNKNSDFKSLFIEAIKWTIVIEFFVNFFTFSLTKEFFILPVLVMTSMMQLYASYDKKYKQVEDILKFILAGVSIFIFSFSLYKTITNSNDFFTIENLKAFLLPVILSITFLPFLYIFNLVVKYELLWVVLNCNIRDKRNRQSIKRKIILIANLNIDKVVSISRNIAKPINIYHDFSSDMIKKVSKGRYVGFDEEKYQQLD